MCIGLVENVNVTLTKSLRKLRIERPRARDVYLLVLLFSLREVSITRLNSFLTFKIIVR